MKINEIISRVDEQAQVLGENTGTMTPIDVNKAMSMFGRDAVADMLKNNGSHVLFDRDKQGRSWKLVKLPDGTFYVERDYMMEGDSVIFEGRDKAIAGVIVEISGDRMVIEGGMFPMIGPEEAPGEMETDLSTMPHRDEILAISSEIWHLMHEVPDDYDTEDELNYLDDQGRKLGFEPVIGIDDYPFLDVNWHHKESDRYFKITPKDLKQDQRFRGTVNEKEIGDRRSFTVSIKFEDGGKATRVFLAKDKEDALKKAMAWGRHEYYDGDEHGMEAKVVAESDAANAITQAFSGMAAGVKTGLVRRAGLLALQGRYSEAENTIRHLLKDINPSIADKIKKSIKDIKPVKVGDRTADTSAIEKSKAHTDWLDNTFVPWVEKLLGKGLAEAEYHGRKVNLGKPMAGDVKKYKVYVKDPKTGNIKKVNFGDKGMEIKRDDPKRRKSFRARHGCGTPRASNRTKAAYWSCRMWSNKPVSKILKGK